MKQKRVIYGVWFFFRDHVYLAFQIFRNLSYVKQILNGILHMFKKTMMKPKQFLSANNNVLLI